MLTFLQIEQWKEDVIDETLKAYLPTWKLKKLGVSLDRNESLVSERMKVPHKPHRCSVCKEVGHNAKKHKNEGKIISDNK